ncbi:MAG: hypothetical protein DCC68_01735 [Planctomycetota bacterium]|nr:MAG: hypothetical protein DCC68_01735 [Planctomycetota bacterium]
MLHKLWLILLPIVAVAPPATNGGAQPEPPRAASPVDPAPSSAGRKQTDAPPPATTSTPAPRRHPDAVEAFHCGFESDARRDWDENHDLMPDGWTRRSGPAYPHYLKIELTAAEAAEGKHALRVALNGGAAAVASPPIEVGPEFSYVLECQVKTVGLVHNAAYMTIGFFDTQNKQLAYHESTRVTTTGGTDGWTKLRIGPVAPPAPDSAYAVISLVVEPTGKTDIRGEVFFDDVWLAHMPRMTVVTSGRHNVFAESERFEVTCKISGILEHDPMISFELVDISSRGVDRSAQKLKGAIVERKNARIERIKGLWRHAVKGYAGEAKWSPASVAPGFYRVMVTMRGQSGLMQQREVTFAVVRPERPQRNGEFGWSLPTGERPLELAQMADLLGHAAVSRVKFPVWHNADDLARGNQLVRFAERLTEMNISIVGLLHEPPSDIRSHFGEDKELYAANVFTSEPELWYRSLEPTMTRLSSKINSWQLGLDNDSSFDGFPGAKAAVQAVKKQLEQFGQSANLGVGWRWVSDVPAMRDAPWKFLALSADPPLTDVELDAYLTASRERGVQRWVVLEPLPRDRYPMEVRAADLVQRMMAAKIGGAESVFVPDPFNGQHGLMNEDGSPGELFLTWRTTSLALSGSTYLGQIPMPGGSQNQIFSRGEDAVMVVWNIKPTEEELFFGREIEVVDVWGRRSKPPLEQGRSKIAVGPLPTFITGVSGPIMRLSMDFRFTVDRLPNVYGKPHRSGFVVTNHFPQGLGGTITLNLPTEWRRRIKPFSVKLAAGETRTYPFDVVIPIDANSGPQEIQVDFDLHVDEHYQFSLKRQIEVGLGDVTVDVTTSLTTNGVLVVKQEMTNNTDQTVDFKCYLAAPNERRMQTQVYRLGRGKDIKFYRYPNGRELLGKTLYLKAEEVDGLRTLNYRFEARE